MSSAPSGIRDLSGLANQSLAGQLSQRMYVVPGRWPGMVQPGNIDLNSRPVVHNQNGSISTVRSISFNVGGHEVLMPTVVNGQIVSPRAALQNYYRTGQHLGVFTNPSTADAYAQALHVSQAAKYLGH